MENENESSRRVRFSLGILLVVCGFALGTIVMFYESKRTRTEMRELRLRVTRLEEMALNPHARFWLIDQNGITLSDFAENSSN